MWPRLVASRGKGATRSESPEYPEALQCGRGSLAAERSDRRLEGGIDGASMWPRLVSRGKVDGLQGLPVLPLRPSMWPRLASRGRASPSRISNRAGLSLQCGRGSLAAEGRIVLVDVLVRNACFNVAAAC